MAEKPFKIYSFEDLKTSPIAPNQFVIEPIVSIPGITLMHGKSNTGKSALLVTEGVCVAEGKPFLGMPTTKGRVLIIEVDMIENDFKTRFKGVYDRIFKPESQNIQVMFAGPFNVLNPLFIHSTRGQQLAELARDYKPQLVLVDSLRKTFSADERDGQVPTQVYDWWMQLFPDSAIQFIHHDKKTVHGPGRPTAPSEEDFSGHQGWRNDCQSMIHVIPTAPPNSNGPNYVALEHTKSQSAGLAKRIDVTINAKADWAKLTNDTAHYEKIEKILEQCAAEGITKEGEIDEKIGEAFGVKARQGHTRKKAYEQWKASQLAKAKQDMQAALNEGGDAT